MSLSDSSFSIARRVGSATAWKTSVPVLSGCDGRNETLFDNVGPPAVHVAADDGMRLSELRRFALVPAGVDERELRLAAEILEFERQLPIPCPIERYAAKRL